MRPTDRPETAFWRRIWEWRNAQWIKPTQTQMAELFDVSTSALSSWKYGPEVPSMNNLLVVSEVTKIPFEELARLVELAIAARRGIRRRSVTDAPQDEAGEGSQDDGGMEPA